MNIAIITATITECDFFPNIIELKKTAEKRGHRLDLFKNGEFQLLVDKGITTLFNNGEEIDPSIYDVAINRLSVREKSNADYYVVEEFIRAGVRVFNTADAIAKARNKLLSLQIMSDLNVNLTKSFVIRRHEDLEHVNKHFTFPVILKNIYGSLGSSTLLIYDYKQLRATFDYLWNINRNDVILIQEFVESDDKSISDFRVFVLGDEVVASMQRISSNDDFRANYKRGARVLYNNISKEEEELSLKIVKAFGLEMAGVDFIRTANGPVFLEINSNPGLEGIRKATQSQGFDILDKIIDYCEKIK